MKTFLAILFLAPMLASAAFKTPAEVKFLMNQGYGSAAQLGTHVTDKKVHILKAQWDYSQVGGASGSISLRDVDNKAAVLPDNAIITDCIIDVITAPTSSGGAPGPTVALSTGQSAGDLKAAAAYSGYTGLMACIPVGTAATSIKLTANRTPTITITTGSITATHSLTGGKIDVLIQYLLGI